MKRAISSFLLLLLIAAPSASADGFREAEVRKALTAAGFGNVADKVAPASRPVVIMDRTVLEREPEALGASRLGGRPDLPAGVTWPRCKRKHQTFLGQIRVRELPSAARELRRAGGTLLFFTRVELEPGEREFGLWAGDCTKVVHARPGATLTRTQFPGGVLELQPTKLRPRVRPDVPTLTMDEDFLMPPLHDLVVPGWERWYEFRHALNGKPEVEHRLLGYTEAPNGGDDCSARAERVKSTWRHLFALGYDERIGWEVGDGGTIQVLISPKDLRAGRFDRTCGLFTSS